jgi:hypothetical protein
LEWSLEGFLFFKLLIFNWGVGGGHLYFGTGLGCKIKAHPVAGLQPAGAWGAFGLGALPQVVLLKAFSLLSTITD